ncbi:hypothetical protein BN961_00734 [Afipia felis]|uniref:Uncharacterized protein n=1 Tax=Afipia felis TaxID=1035 RepID=A0A090MIH0_AFIFE|nr:MULTISPECIES: hypothetical protein [Afipia]EFI52186.1 hypothetical protein AfiDRAFT_0172 [Afipia sp. 1NLS2]CEG07345.1 hypothetical protein BN961_00734 [Afipia felis]
MRAPAALFFETRARLNASTAITLKRGRAERRMRARIRSLMRDKNKRTSRVTTGTPHHPAFRTQWF